MPEHYNQKEVESHFSDLEIIEYIASGGFKDVFLVNDAGREYSKLSLLRDGVD